MKEGNEDRENNKKLFVVWIVNRLFCLFRASPAIIAKVAIKKVHLSILVAVFSIFSQTDSLFYSLLAFKYNFVREKVWKK